MKIFVFEYVAQCSYNYHSDGGVVIVAEDREDAMRMVAEDEYLVLEDSDWEAVDEYDCPEDRKSIVYVFPNAGCC